MDPGWSDRLLNDLLEHGDDILGVSDPTTGTMTLTDQVRTMLGYAPAELSTFRQWEAIVHPDDLERCLEVWNGDTLRYDLEYRARRADGRWIWVRDRGLRVADRPGYRGEGVFVITEVTARREAAERLAASEALYRRLLESQQGVTFWEERTNDGDNDYVSPQVEALTGYPVEHFFGRGAESWYALIHPDDRDRIVGRSGTDWEGTYEYRIIRADGATAWVRETSVVVRDSDGTPVRRIGATLDVTLARAAEEERRRRDAEAAELDRLEASARTAAATAHDFRNTLAGIDLVVKALEATPGLTEAMHRDLAAIRAAVTSGRAETEMIVSLGRTGRRSLEVVDLHDEIGRLRPTLATRLGEQLALRLDLRAAPSAAAIERTDFERALLNLAANARDAGARTMTISTERTRKTRPDDQPLVGAPIRGERIVITVTDDGAGMDERTRMLAFEPFFTSKPVGAGTGLGLSSVHAFVLGANGHAHLESGAGTGTTVRLCIPVA